MKLIAYTDASYRSEHDIAACGFMVYCDEALVKNSVLIVGQLGNVEVAEIFAIKQALMWCYLQQDVSFIVINNDQKVVCRHVRKYFGGKEKYQELQEIVDIIDGDGIPLHFNKVRSHGSNENHNRVDENCSKCLREYIRKLPAKPAYSKKRKKAA